MTQRTFCSRFIVKSTAVLYQEDSPFTMRMVLENNDAIEVRLETIYHHDFKNIPIGFLAKVYGSGNDIKLATKILHEALMGTLIYLSFTTNATVWNPIFLHTIETTKNETFREILENYVEGISFQPLPVRRVNVDIIEKLSAAINGVPDSSRYARAISYYTQALKHWLPGEEILAAHPLWMAAETITPLVRSLELIKTGLTKDEFCQSWGIPIKDLDSEIRKRIIFEGKLDVYNKLKNAADGYEHGYLDFTEIHKKSMDTMTEAANRIRICLFKILGFSDEELRTVTEEPYTKPFACKELTVYAIGTLYGDDSALSQLENTDIKIIKEVKVKDIKQDSSSLFQGTFSAIIEPIIPDGVTFTEDNIEIYGGKKG